MKYLQVLLLVVVLTFASGATQSARPEEHSDQPSVTLYTLTVNANDFRCNVTNVSHKTLDVVITVLDETGAPFKVTGNPSDTLSIHPGAVGSQDSVLGLHPPQEGYCKFEVFGTHNPNDVRVALTVRFITTFVDPITNEMTGALIVRTLEGH